MIGRLSLLSRTVLLLTLALFAALTVTQLIAFGAPWGVTAAPDMRWRGYSAEDIMVFLEAIGPDGRDVFFGVYRWLDTAFPPLLAMSLIILFRCMRSLRAGLWIALFALLPMGYLVADLVENGFLSELADAEMFEQTVRYASSATAVKYLCLVLAAAGIIVVAMRPYRKAV